jgi:ornithine carbamoyltransferase
MSVGQLAEKISGTKTGFYQRDFLQTWQHSVDELRAVLGAAEALEELYKANISCRVFNGGIAVSNFRDQSTRTRFSFASAAALLGLQLQELDEGKSQIAHGETVRETANMISFLAEAIGIRASGFGSFSPTVKHQPDAEGPGCGPGLPRPEGTPFAS